MRERALQFGDSGNLVGILTEPGSDGEGDRPGVVLLNAGILHRVGPSRMNVRIARRLAREGFPCLRFDFSGIGDSDPRPDRLAFEESSVREIRAAADQLQRMAGSEEIVLVGLCSGADAAVHGALADPRVVGLVPVDGYAYRTWRWYLHHYLPRLVRAESWLHVLTGKTYVGPWIRRLLGLESAPPPSPEADLGGGVFQRPTPPRDEAETMLGRLAARGVRMLHLFSGGMRERYNHARQFRDTFPSLPRGEAVQVRFFADADHTFTELGQLDALVETIGRWARESWPARTVEAPEEPEGVRAA